MNVRLDAAALGHAARACANPAGARTCRECGAPQGPEKAAAEFCCNPCRAAWNNRRAKRGAELYDLFMALRFDRPLARKLSLWRLICRLAAQYRAEDHDRRAGRDSWRDPRRVIEERPWLQAVVVTNNAAGTRR
jgi:hypothetical protein